MLKADLQASGEIKNLGKNDKAANQTFGRLMIYEVKLYLNQNFTRPDIEKRTNEIASIFNTSSKTLNRAFTKAYGITVSKLIKKLKMEKALLLLKQNKTALSEVCEAVGYKDVYNFSRKFKEYHGFSAKEVPANSL
ncbi:HTH-type transcriptional activator Btr [compost metagenome]